MYRAGPGQNLGMESGFGLPHIPSVGLSYHPTPFSLVPSCPLYSAAVLGTHPPLSILPSKLTLHSFKALYSLKTLHLPVKTVSFSVPSDKPISKSPLNFKEIWKYEIW